MENASETTYEVCGKSFTPASSQTTAFIVSTFHSFHCELSNFQASLKYANFLSTMQHVNMFMIAPLEMQAHVRDRREVICALRLQVMENL